MNQNIVEIILSIVFSVIIALLTYFLSRKNKITQDEKAIIMELVYVKSVFYVVLGFYFVLIIYMGFFYSLVKLTDVLILTIFFAICLLPLFIIGWLNKIVYNGHELERYFFGRLKDSRKIKDIIKISNSPWEEAILYFNGKKRIRISTYYSKYPEVMEDILKKIPHHIKKDFKIIS